jgi:hypothetical protein
VVKANEDKAGKTDSSPVSHPVPAYNGEMQEVSFTALLMQETRRRKIVHMGVNTRSCAKNLVFRISTLENARCQTGQALGCPGEDTRSSTIIRILLNLSLNLSALVVMQGLRI